MHRRTIELSGPIHLERSLLRRTTLFMPDPTQRAVGSDVLVATRTEQGPATLRFAMREERRVEVAAWGPGAAAALEKAPGRLGVDDRGHDDWIAQHPRLARLRERMPGLRFGRTGQVFERLTPSILAQRVTSREAAHAYGQLLFRYGERAPAPSPKLWILPEPSDLATLPYYAFHPLGVERRRAELLTRVAKRATFYEALADRPEELRSALRATPGVGPWTTAMVMNAVCGDADAVPVGDYGIPHLVGFALTGRPRSTDEEMLELLEPYRPHRARVIALLMASGLRAPRFGPRRRIHRLG